MTEKNEQIKQSIKDTRERHKDMVCRVFEVKIISGKLSHEKKEYLESLFREAKWLRNGELAKDDISKLNRNVKTATVKVGAEFEERPLKNLGSQMRQDIVDQLKSDIRGLSVLKKHGHKVGKLKFKSYCNSVPLRQYGTTFRVDFTKKTISVQGFRKPFKVRGLKQLVGEITNAKLVRKPSGYYFHITTYSEHEHKALIGEVCGIDFGIGNNLTLNNYNTVNVSIPESHAVKVASIRLNKAYHRNGNKKSKNHYKRQARLRRAYERQNNRKHDIANKVVHDLLEEYDIIAIQDEMIANWHKGLFGKQVQHSAMGYIKAKLKNSSKTIVVDRSFPSTQKCPVCGQNTKHPLSKRDYDCKYCGYHHPSRDVKAADLILNEALRNASIVSPEQRAQSPVETKPAVTISDVVDKVSSVKQEAQVL